MDKSEFDELDRAVQSLVSDTEQTSSPSRPVASRREDVVRQRSAANNSTAATQPIAASAPAANPRPTIQTRPRGRFMDIVPPRKPTAKAPSSVASRTGVSIEPIDQPSPSATEPTQPEISNELDNILAQPEFTPESNPAVEQSIQPKETLAPTDLEATALSELEVNEFDDQPVKENQVVDMANQLASDEAEPEQAKADEPNLIDNDHPVATEQPAPAEPVEPAPAVDELDDFSDLVDLDEDEPESEKSPFISGAQVEKRPLGKDQSVAHDAISSIEKEPDTTQPVAAEQPAQPAQPAEAPQETAKKKPFMRNNMTGGKVKKAPESSDGPTSIAQQYTVDSNAANDQPASSMYDAANYTQPLAHPAKKKSGWLGVLWIVLLLIVGGGGAFIAYQLHLF